MSLAEKPLPISVIYPTDYREAFDQPDEDVVENYFDYIRRNLEGGVVEAIVISPTERNETETVDFIAVNIEGKTAYSEQINWGHPGEKITNYDGYARGDTMFHLFSGELETQTRRAKLLSEKLHCPVWIVSLKAIEKTGITIPSLTITYHKKLDLKDLFGSIGTIINDD